MVECNLLFMEQPGRLSFEGMHRSTHCLKLAKNLDGQGQKPARQVWNQYLVEAGLVESSFVQSKAHECVFYKRKTILLICATLLDYTFFE